VRWRNKHLHHGKKNSHFLKVVLTFQQRKVNSQPTNWLSQLSNQIKAAVEKMAQTSPVRVQGGYTWFTS
jgi:hypothetical protein